MNVNIDIDNWEFNIFEIIRFFSDLEHQRKLWLGNSLVPEPDLYENICTLYDSFDFQKYIEYCINNGKSTTLIKLLQEIDNMLDDYKLYTYDSQNLIDPNWIKITEKASEICSLEYVKKVFAKNSNKL